MTDTEALIKRATMAGVRLWTSEGELCFRAPAGSLGEELRAQLRAHRSEVIALLDQARQSEASTEAVPILTFYRELWWKIREGVLDVTFTNATHWLARVEGALDPQVLEEAIRQLVRRHSILCGGVADVEGEPHFVFDRTVRLISTEVTEADSSDEAISRMISELVWRPFDVHGEPFFRPFLIKFAHERHIVGFVLHHLVGDAWSVMTLRTELVEAYLAATRGSTQPLKVHRPQYATYVTELNQWIQSPDFVRRVRYWREHLKSAHPSRLIPNYVPAAETQGIMRAEPFSLDAECTKRLRQIAAEHGTTLFAVFAAAKLYTLRRSLGVSQLLLLTMFSGRTSPEYMDTVGSMQNQLPIQVQIDDDISIEKLAKRVQRTCTSSYGEQIPYHYARQLLSELGIAEHLAELNFNDTHSLRSRAAAPPVQTGLKFTTLSVGEWPISKSTPRYVPGHSLIVKADSTLSGVMVYLDCLYAPTNIESFLHSLRRLLTRAAAHPNRPLAELF